MTQELTMVKKLIENLSNDLDLDRQRFEDRFNQIDETLHGIDIRLKSLEASVPSTKVRIKDAVVAGMQEVTQPVIDATQGLTDQIEKAHETSLIDKLFKPKNKTKVGE